MKPALNATISNFKALSVKILVIKFASLLLPKYLEGGAENMREIKGFLLEVTSRS